MFIFRIGFRKRLWHQYARVVNERSSISLNSFFTPARMDLIGDSPCISVLLVKKTINKKNNDA